MEKWKKIKGHEAYEISSHGRCRSIDRWILGKNKSTSFKIYKKGALKKLHHDTKGYLRASLPKGVTTSVARLVAILFINNPENKPEVNHINGIKTDNRVENLEWCTSSENVKHAWSTGLNNSSNHGGVKHGQNKLNEKQIRLIKHLKGLKISQAKIASIFKVNQTLISAIHTEKIWKHIKI